MIYWREFQSKVHKVDLDLYPGQVTQWTQNTNTDVNISYSMQERHP